MIEYCGHSIIFIITNANHVLFFFFIVVGFVIH